MPKKLGRPKKKAGERLTRFFRVRLSPEDYDTVSQAIRDSGQNMSDWLRTTLLKAARTP
jgi:hypothetical protein